MSNRLRKALKYTFVPGTEGSPGYPGYPAQPAYSYVTSRQVCVYSPSNYTEAEARLLDLLRSVGGTVSGITYSAGGYACTTVQSVVYVPSQPGMAPTPGTPGTPSQTLQDFQLGWTGRAYSLAVMTGPGRFSCTVPASAVGVVVGLTRAPQNSGYGDIEFGFYVARGITKIMEGGVEVLNLGSRAGQPLEIRRTKGNIEYRVNDVLVYTRTNSSTPYVLGASLYSGGDEVTSPTFEAFGEGGGAGVMRPFTGYAGGAGVSLRRGAGVMLPFTGVAYSLGISSGAGSMLPFKGLGGDAYAIGRGAMASFIGQAETLAGAPSFSLASGSMVPFTGTANGLTGGNGEGSGLLSLFAGFAGDLPGGVARGSGRGAMRPFRSTVFNLTPADEVFVASFGGTASDISSATELFLVMNSSATAISLIAVSVEYLAELVSAASATSSAALQMEIEALLKSVLRASSLLNDPSQVAVSDTWVYNMDVEGTTRYSHFDFNSFAKIDGKYFGARADGVYELAGPDDAGTDVDVKVDFGNLDFGTLARKGLPVCYAGVASDGKLILKVVADGETFLYTVTDEDTMLKAQRFVLGRGLRASYYGITLLNEGGSAFDMESITFMPVTLSRRK